MKKKLLSVFLVLNIFAMAGCGSEEGSATENWIDSDIEGNISAETTISEKDDFAAAANRELYESGDFSGAAIRNISRTVTERKREIVEDSSITGKGIEEVRKYINLAEDIDQRNSLGSEPLLPYIRDIESISSVEELYDWMVDTDRNPLGVAPVKAFGPGRSEVDPSAYYVLLDSGRLTLPTGSGMDDGYYHLGEQSLEKMVITEEKVELVLSGMGYSEEEIDRILDNSYRFEKRLRAITKNNMGDDEEELTFTREEVMYVQGDYPMIEYLDNRGYKDCSRYMMDSDYLKRMDNLCVKYIDEIKSMCIVQYVVSLGKYLDEETMLAFEKIDEPRGVETAPETRTEDQIAEDRIFNTFLSNTALVGALNEAYIDKYISPDSYERLYNMTEDLIDAYRTIFAGEDWLSEEGKKACIEKLDAIKVHVIKPSDTDYSDLYIDTAEEGGNFLEAALEVYKFGEKQNAKLCASEVDREFWDPYETQMSTTITNSFYYPITNGIYILAGILADPAYEESMSDEQMLAGIGSIVGHEITHGFDAEGVKYDKDGMEKDWMPEDDKTAFSERTTKVILYYTSLKPFDASGNYSGPQVVTEATADMGGMRACLLLGSKDEDFDYKEFFEQYARLWAAQYSYEEEQYYFMYDMHPLNYLRINVTLSQFDEFHRTYDVKEGDGMYVTQDKRIAVW